MCTLLWSKYFITFVILESIDRGFFALALEKGLQCPFYKRHFLRKNLNGSISLKNSTFSCYIAATNHGVKKANMLEKIWIYVSLLENVDKERRQKRTS